MQKNKDRKRSTSKQIIARVSFKCFYDRAVFYVIAWRDTGTHTHTHTRTHTEIDSCVQHNEKRHLSYSSCRSHSSLIFHFFFFLSFFLSPGEPLRPRTRNNKKEQRKAAETAIINPFEKFAIVAKLVTGNSFVVMKEFRGICGRLR